MASCLQPPSACEVCNRESRILFPRGEKWLCIACNLAKIYAPQEIIARTKKVYSLAQCLDGYGITGNEARRLDAEQWAIMARRFGIKTPSLETKLLVVQTLEAQGVTR